MTSLTDSGNNTTTWTRDNLERVTAEKNQLGYSRTYVWDPANNLTQETDRDGRVRDFTVNHLNETTAEQWMQGTSVVNTISTAYNADGEVTSAGDSYSSYTLAYDGEGSLASVDNNGTPGVPHVVLTSQWDGQGDRTSLSATIAGVKDFLNSYSYDTLSRMTSISQQSQTGGNTVAPKSLYLGYDGVGDITTIDRSDYVGMGPNPPDAADSALSYNALGQLTGITPQHSGVNIDPLSWTYNTLGLPATFTDSNGTATYGYDKDNQVTSVTYTGTGQPANESYTLDANGNRTNNGFQVGTNNQLTTDGTFNYQFDQEGNRTVRTRISNSYAVDYKTTYSWDYRNRLTDVDFYDNNNVLTKHVHYTYDVFNNLLSQSLDSTGAGSYNQITYFVYDLTKPTGFPGQSLDPTAVDAAVLEFVDPDGSGPEPAALAERMLVGPDLAGLVDQVYAQENVATGAVTWLLPDNLDSTRDAVDANGNVLAHYVYNSFGQLVSGPTSVTQFLFTGRWNDTNTGLQYNGNRWYDPAVGRWISEDPADLTYDTNASRYVGNQTTTYVDPAGLAGELGNGTAPLVWPSFYSGPPSLSGHVPQISPAGSWLPQFEPKPAAEPVSPFANKPFYTPGSWPQQPQPEPLIDPSDPFWNEPFFTPPTWLQKPKPKPIFDLPDLNEPFIQPGHWLPRPEPNMPSGWPVISQPKPRPGYPPLLQLPPRPKPHLPIFFDGSTENNDWQDITFGYERPLNPYWHLGIGIWVQTHIPRPKPWQENPEGCTTGIVITITPD